MARARAPRKPRGPSKRVVMNREAVGALLVGYADGLHQVGLDVIAAAHVPDAPPLGVGLVNKWGVATVAVGKRVASSGPVGNIPREGAAPKGSITTVVGYGFPGRFVELGTSDTAPQPFLTPAIGAVVGGAGATVAESIKAHLAKVR